MTKYYLVPTGFGIYKQKKPKAVTSEKKVRDLKEKGVKVYDSYAEAKADC